MPVYPSRLAASAAPKTGVFAAQSLDAGYLQLAKQGTESKCGADKEKEGKCGADKAE